MVALKVRKSGTSRGVLLPKDVISHLQTGDAGTLYPCGTRSDYCIAALYLAA
jgi:hypothetical protein